MRRTDYVRCDEQEIPPGVRFDVAGRNQGQMVELAYGGFDRSEHDEGDPFMRITDFGEVPGSADRVAYYRLAKS